MIRYFAAHPTASNLIMVAIMVIGIAAAGNVKRETFPDIPPDLVEITAIYPGASAQEVENAICQRIEEAVDGTNDIKEVRCRALEGVGTVTIEMTDDGDINRLQEDIKADIDAITTFPDTVERPIVKQLGRRDFVVAVGLSGPMSVPDLKAYAESVKNRMLAEGNISQVDIRGFSDHQFRVEIPAITLRQFGLSVSQIAERIARQSIDLPSGGIKTRTRDVLIRFQDERRTIRELQELVIIGSGSGAEIRLGDIATITDRFERDEDKIVINGQRAALLMIYKTRAEDTLTVVDAVGEFVERERAQTAKGVEIILTRNISSIVRDRLNMLMRNGAQGLFLVFLIMWLFFSFRFSFWVAMGLPVSFLGTVFIMSVLGYSFDMITMVGLLIAIGLLMDDAIVLSENIATQLSKGKSPLDAAVDGARQVAPGVIMSYLTTICVFGSLMFLKGEIGAILGVLPVILIATLSVSLIEAFLILPHHLAHSLEGREKIEPSAFRRRFEAGLAWTRERVVGRLVDTAVEWRYLSLGLAISMLLITIALVIAGAVKFRAFPNIDGDVIEARILLPQGTPLARTEEVVRQVTEALQRVDARYREEQSQNKSGGRPLVSNVMTLYNTNTDAGERGPHVATVSVDLLSAEIRDIKLARVLNQWRREAAGITDTIAINFIKFRHGPGGRAIDIRLFGTDLGQLKAASLDLQAWLRSYRGTLDITDDLRPGKPEIRLRLSEGAVALGLDASTIAGQLRAAFFGQTAGEIQVGPESYEIDVRLARRDTDSLADLEYFTVTLPGGKQVPLGAVARVEQGRGYARINRIDGRRTLTIQGQVDSEVANTNEIISHMKKNFLTDFLARHPGVSLALEGQAKEGATTGQSMQRGFLLGLIGVFLLLCFQFRSYIEPIVVMAIIPLGLIGVVAGHYIMGLEISMPSILGFASLAGIVVNDSILLVHFIKIKRNQGMSTQEAACQASRERFRAVLLTSLTTIAGLLPLLLETSLQAQVLIPLVTSLTFGLLVTTLMVLFLIPVLYTILDDWGLSVEADMNTAKAVAS